MPRTGKGSKSAPYGNRQDLNLPTTTVPNQEYGEAAQQAAAQNAIPMAAGQRNPSPQAPAAPQSAAAPAATLPAPGSMPLIAPTQRPNEPITAGMPTGDGPGPEAFGVMQPAMTPAQELAYLASTPEAGPALQQIAAMAARAGH